MGYDSNECVICYCDGGVNNCGEHVKSYNLCSECYTSESKCGLRGRARSDNYITIYPDVECTFCEEIKVCLYQVSLCLDHVESLNKEKRELKENTYEEGSACRGRCNCPHCPVEDYKDLFDKKD